jgi:aromatic-amino-acid transaminase
MTMNDSILPAIPMAPRDPILGITEAFRADENPNKTNLGVGVYSDDNGKVPLLKCVVEAEKIMAATETPHTYLPIDGIAVYDTAVQKLVFGEDNPAVKEQRISTVQAIGGTGALKIGADFLKRFSPDSEVWISDPSWQNHFALFDYAGFKTHTYPYYDEATHGVNFKGMMDTFKSLKAGSIVLLHACCHNPTGADLTDAQWDEVIAVVKERRLIPFLDMAYQGFSNGIAEDGKVVRRFSQEYAPVLVSNSFSKSFSLYGERVGAFSLVASNADESARVLSQLKRVIRTNYSNPPIYGAKIVGTVLSDPALRKMWEDELASMRDRIHVMRHQLVDKLSAKKPGMDFSFITRQAGMFSYSGLNKAQAERLKNEFSIYIVGTGRICVAALNSHNIDYVVDAIAHVL